jgi:hypothetical protein
MRSVMARVEELVAELEAIDFFDRDFALCLLSGEGTGTNDPLACASRYLRKCEIHSILQSMAGRGRA